MKTEKPTFTLDDLRLVGQGREAEIFAWPDSRVLRLRRKEGPLATMAVELSAAETARSAGVRVPDMYEQIMIDGRPGVVMEQLRGPDLLSILGPKPWMVLHSGQRTGAIHAQINAVRAGILLPRVGDIMRRRLRRLADHEPKLAERVERILGQLPDGDALCHGDFHPGQLMRANSEWVALDWSGAKRGHPLFDHARTKIVLSIGEPPPGTSLVLKMLAKVGRKLLIASYIRSYERHAGYPVDQDQLRRWEIVNMAARLVEAIPGERPRLLRRLRKELARCKEVTHR